MIARSRPRRVTWIALAGWLAVPLLAAEPAAPPADPGRAIELYDAGRYAEAGAALAEIDRRGAADGALLYRLYFCQRAAGDPEAPRTLERSRERLEQEVARDGELEAAFYLANAYANLNRPADALRVATDATRRIESGQSPEPADAAGMFQLGKLYTDRRLPDAAAPWYERALAAGTARPGGLAPAYSRWAAQFLGDRAYAAEDWDRAERYLEARVGSGEKSPELLDRLAVSQARLGLWSAAATTWREAVLLDPANADRARYCGQIADQAASLGTLPATAPDGRLWAALGRDELERVLGDQAAVVRGVRQEVGPDAAVAPDRRAVLQRGLDDARALFIAAALEYALRGLPIRETAFTGGYAPLVFHAEDWLVPSPPVPEQ